MPHAFNIRLQDPEVHGYAQKYCFLNGPDRALNRKLRRAVLESKVELPDERDAQRLVLISLDEQRSIEQEMAAQLRVPPQLGLDPKTVRDWTRNLAWKVGGIPETAKDVLVLGTASCREAIFIRQRLPSANIVCTDFEDHRLAHVESALNVRFHQGDFHELLTAHKRGFDVIFSNHVLEHLFDPERTFALSKEALRERGCMVAALPLDGQASAPWSAVLNACELHPIDMCRVDVAHAWKTNLTDILQHLNAAGFSEVTFRGRDKHYSVAERVFADQRAFERRAKLGEWLNRAVFGSMHEALKVAFSDEVPASVLKVLFGAEHRVWFGSNRLKNEFSVECLVTAK